MNLFSLIKSLRPNDLPVLLQPFENNILNTLSETAERDNKEEIVVIGFGKAGKLNFVLASLHEEKKDNVIVQTIDSLHEVEILGRKYKTLNTEILASQILTKDVLKQLTKNNK